MSDSDDNIPDVRVCEQRCKEFAEITSTDTACAQYFLNSVGWDVARATNAYFDSMLSAANDPMTATIASFCQANRSVLSGLATEAIQGQTTLEQQSTLRFITWNIDGLGENSRNQRMQRVCEIIKTESPLVVHLQEVTPTIYEDLLDKLSDQYMLIAGVSRPEIEDYFVMTLLKKNAVKCELHEITKFVGSAMGRTLLLVKARIGTVPFLFLNTHLESTRDFAAERKRQLSTTFKRVLESDAKMTVIFAGDLNLRDNELVAIGGLPAGVEDLWMTSGKRDELKYTWDAHRNTNIDMPNGRYARCRFDRAYLRQASPGRVTLKHFGFVGLEKISGCGRYPSDHWGLVAQFDLD